MNTLKKIKANQKGFTLVELIVVVAILGVLAAVAVPNYMNYLYKTRVSTDLDTARAVINVARTMTMTTGSAPTLSAALADADMTDNKSASDPTKTLSGIFTLYTSADPNNFKITVSIASGTGAGKYYGSYDVTERGEIPAPTKKS